MIKPLILSGGKGSRLWPLSRELYPKQYLSVHTDKTLFQETVARTRQLGEDIQDPIVICNNEHRFFVAEQLQKMEINGDIILEPMGRDTAPAVAIGALLANSDDPLLFVMPADHVIKDEKALKEAVSKAAKLADQGYLVTFGITPTHPETGYGYLHSGEAVGEGMKVQRFVEKPDLPTAESYLASGDYYWNSGMFLFRASHFLEELGKLEPAMLTACKNTFESRYEDLDFIRLDADSFGACPANSIDYAVMEKTDRCAMVPLSAGWNDLGSWSSLYDVGEKDENGNVQHGDIITSDASNCYLHAETRLLAAVGVDDVIAIETPDAVLVTHRDKAQDVKAIYNNLKKNSRSEAVAHSMEYRPWGSFESIAKESRFQVKRLIVKPGQTLSLQMHHHRSEHWIVVRGTAKVTNGEKEFLLTEDQSTYIPLGTVHRLENPGKVMLEIIEIQTGSYLGEDDIVRFEDVYGRTPEK